VESIGWANGATVMESVKAICRFPKTYGGGTAKVAKAQGEEWFAASRMRRTKDSSEL